MYQLHFTKIARLHRSHLYSNSINTGTIQARSQLFINFVSAKVQGCIGVTYTATQSTLGLFKVEVDYSSTLFQKVQDYIGVVLYSNCNQYWDYLSQKLIIFNFILAKVQDCIGVTYTATQSTLELFKLEVRLFINFVSAKVQDCIGVAYTAMQSILELFKLEVDYSSISFWQKCKIAQESLIQQLNQHWDYLSQKSIIHQFPFSKSARLHRSHLYSNSINTGTIQARSQLFINFVSAKVQGCIGVTYTATQSTLGLFKLEVDYSSTLFQQKCKIAQESLIQQLNQHWDYLSQKLIIHQLFINLHRSHFQLEKLFQQKCKIAQESLIQQLSQHWDYLSQKLIIHQLCFSKSARLHRSHLYSNSINTGTI